MLHPWSLSPEEAIRVQAALHAQLSLTWDNRAVETIGGVDLSLQEDVVFS